MIISKTSEAAEKKDRSDAGLLLELAYLESLPFVSFKT